MYSIVAYGEMLADRQRRDAYLEVLRTLIDPHTVVLEIGTGPGYFALAAAKLGAAHVHAVEPDDTILLAEQMARQHGLADRITFHQQASTDLELDRPADLIFSDLRGVLPLYGGNLAAIRDARERLLATDGHLVPQQDHLFAALVSAPESYDRLVAGWRDDVLDLDLEPGRQMAVNHWHKVKLQPEQCAVPPTQWATIDYLRHEADHVSGRLAWEVDQPGLIHGIGLWFDTCLHGQIGFSNAPGSKTIYGQGMLPLAEPRNLAPGDRVEVRLHAQKVGVEYVWRWRLKHERSEQPTYTVDQSTFFARPVSPARLQKNAATYRPSRAVEGEVSHFVLKHMNGQKSNAEIGDALQAAFPHRFPTAKAALDQVCSLVARYG